MVNLTAEWQSIFKYAAAVAKDMCVKNPNLTYSQAMKHAWKDPKVMAKRKEYESKKALKTKHSKTTKKSPKKSPKKSAKSVKK